MLAKHTLLDDRYTLLAPLRTRPDGTGYWQAHDGQAHTPVLLCVLSGRANRSTLGQQVLRLQGHTQPHLEPLDEVQATPGQTAYFVGRLRPLRVLADQPGSLPTRALAQLLGEVSAGLLALTSLGVPVRRLGADVVEVVEPDTPAPSYRLLALSAVGPGELSEHEQVQGLARLAQSLAQPEDETLLALLTRWQTGTYSLKEINQAAAFFWETNAWPALPPTNPTAPRPHFEAVAAPARTAPLLLFVGVGACVLLLLTGWQLWRRHGIASEPIAAPKTLATTPVSTAPETPQASYHRYLTEGQQVYLQGDKVGAEKLFAQAQALQQANQLPEDPLVATLFEQYKSLADRQLQTCLSIEDFATVDIPLSNYRVALALRDRPEVRSSLAECAKHLPKNTPK